MRRRLIFLMLLLVPLYAWAQAASPISPGAAVSLGPPGQPKVSLDAAWSIGRAHPGDQRALAVIVHITPGYHVNPNTAQLPTDVAFNPIPTRLTVDHLDPRLKVGSPQFPKSQMRQVQYTIQPLPVFQGRTIVYLPIIVAADAKPGKATLTVRLDYQACSDQVCFAPASKSWQVTLTIVPAGVPVGAATHKSMFAQFNPTAFAALQSNRASSAASGSGTGDDVVHNDFFGYRFQLDTDSPLGLALVLLMALVAGSLLNFTPCVLPVVPIKIMSLHQQAGNPWQCLRLGLIFSLGIVAAFAVLGALVAGLIVGLGQLQWGEIFAYAPVSVVLAGIIVVMALGMLGLFSFRLPKSVYLLNPSHDTATGNFLLGVLTAVLSTPCTGLLLGATIAWAVNQSALLALATFSVMGVGMALPYLLLTANPRWLEHLPRSGPGSELITQVMGLLLLAVAIFFLGPLIPDAGQWWAIAGMVAVAMAWMVYRTYRITARRGIRLAVPAVAIVLVVAATSSAYMLTRPGPIPWQPFSPHAFNAARTAERTVLVEYTADWCVNCKVLELTVYRDPKLTRLFHRPDYVAFRVDLTSTHNTAGWKRQRTFGAGAGIPLAVVYRPHESKPAAVLRGLFTTNELVDALKGSPANAPRRGG